MLHRILKTTLILLMVFAVGIFAMAQRQTGSITGTVTDEEDIQLPGSRIGSSIVHFRFHLSWIVDGDLSDRGIGAETSQGMKNENSVLSNRRDGTGRI